MKKTGLLILVGTLLLTLQGCSNGPTRAESKKAASYQARLGAGYLQRNRLPLAKEYLDKALKNDPDSAEVRHYYALLEERLGNPQAAALHFGKAINADPKNPELLNNYGTFLCSQGKVSTAEQIFNKAASDPLYKTPEFALANAGVCLKKKGDYQRAADYFNKALTIRAGMPSALYHMAELSHLQRENAKAQAYLYRYNEQTSHTAETLALCYKIHTALNEKHQADECASRLLADFPKSQEARTLN